MFAEKKKESKVLDRSYFEVRFEGKAGKLTRKEAIKAAAEEIGVASENVALVSLDGQAGTMNLLGKFYAYGSLATMKRIHPRYLEERTLTKEEREKLKQERKKAKAPAAPEAKK